MRRNVTTRLARTRAEARDYRSTKSLEGFQIHRLAHAFCNSLELGGKWVGLSWTLLCHRPRLLQSIADVLQHPRVRRGCPRAARAGAVQSPRAARSLQIFAKRSLLIGTVRL